uniref:tagaturonate reductase n=1 Tax=Gemmiger formicilis TaxID=745368 RepID=UPI004029CFAA
METLNYKVLAETGYNGYILKDAPVKVMQFGEGNFLRAFVDYFYDIANEKAGYNGKVKLVQPIGNFPQMADWINEQEGRYTLYLRGSEKGQKVDAKRVISCVSDCVCPYVDGKWDEVLALARSEELETVVSNTTEAGIAYTQGDSAFDQVPPNSFPAKLTRVLYERYKAFNGAADKGLVILSCELIDNNGKELLKCVNQYIDQWGLDDGFRKYVNEDCTFCGSLVDRIVPGRIRDPKEVAELEQKHGYADPLLDVGEVFGVWVIEGDTKLNDVLPFRKAGLESRVFVTPDMSPYKKRKVRILNGAHTGFVLGAYLAGFDIVRDCMHDATVLGYMNKMLLDEVVPILPLDQEDCKKFAAAVQDRFNNPFVNHELMSISLNSTSKWRARNMPSFLEYVGKNGKLPTCLTMSFAAYIAFYSNDVQELTDKGLVCKRAKGNEYTVSDDRWVLEFYNEHKNDDVPTLVHAVMTNEQMWGQDLTKVPGFEEATVKNLTNIRENGALAAYASCL